MGQDRCGLTSLQQSGLAAFPRLAEVVSSRPEWPETGPEAHEVAAASRCGTARPERSAQRGRLQCACCLANAVFGLWGHRGRKEGGSRGL